MKRRPGGVHVKRTERRPRRAFVEHRILFSSTSAFERFCSADALRFAYPLVFQLARREMDALLGQNSIC
jgi:hypothetical protein